MTKKIGLLLLIGLAFLACKDDEAVFDVPVPEDGLRFEAVNGGAIMHYTIPENSAICAICARYVNCWGEEVLVKASPYVDTLSLPGFHAPMKDVPVSVFVTDNNDVPSPAVQRTFSTLASAPYSFMDSVEVVSSWDGVRIQSSYTGEVEGIVDVYHVGISPTTQQTDTLFIKNFAIAEGEINTFISLGDITSLKEDICFVLRSEDAKGNFVRTRIYPGLSQESMRQYGRDSLSVSDPGGFSQEYAEDERANGGISALGIEYLIDGDNKGIRGIENQEYRRMYYTYLTYRDAQGSYVQLELEEPQVLASVRMYGAISNADYQWDFDDGDFYYGYDERLPNHVRLWVTNDDALAAKPDGKDAEDHWTENWTLLAEFYQPADRSGDDWTAHDRINGNDYDLWVAAKPYYADIVCDIVEEKFKYIRVETVDHFASWFLVGDNSKDHFVTYHELEVYVKKD